MCVIIDNYNVNFVYDCITQSSKFGQGGRSQPNFVALYFRIYSHHPIQIVSRAAMWYN